MRKDAAMEQICVFASALFFCVVSAGVHLDGIHWTYTGRLIEMIKLSSQEFRLHVSEFNRIKVARGHRNMCDYIWFIL